MKSSVSNKPGWIIKLYLSKEISNVIEILNEVFWKRFFLSGSNVTRVLKNIVTGEVLRTKVNQLWKWLLCYQNLSTLKWTDDWLTDFKFCYNLKDKKLHNKVNDTDLSPQTFTTMKKIQAENRSRGGRK